MNKKPFILMLIATIMMLASCTKQQNDIHVVLIGVDGWGAYSLPKADMPTVKQLMENGAYTLKRRSILPSVSAPNWASMFMGACPEFHGFTQNSDYPLIKPREVNEHNSFPTIFSVLREERPKAEIGLVYEWKGIKFVVDSLAFSYIEQSHGDASMIENTTRMAEQYIKEKKPMLFAVVYDEIDGAGHGPGHDSPAYYDALKNLDQYITRIVQATKDAGIYDNTVFVLAADHGGIEHSHGGMTLQELESPFIISGKGIKKMGEFDEAMMQYDTAPTIAKVLGINVPQVWNGRAMNQVFE